MIKWVKCNYTVEYTCFVHAILWSIRASNNDDFFGFELMNENRRNGNISLSHSYSYSYKYQSESDTDEILITLLNNRWLWWSKWTGELRFSRSILFSKKYKKQTDRLSMICSQYSVRMWYFPIMDYHIWNSMGVFNTCFNFVGSLFCAHILSAEYELSSVLLLPRSLEFPTNEVDICNWEIFAQFSFRLISNGFVIADCMVKSNNVSNVTLLLKLFGDTNKKNINFTLDCFVWLHFDCVCIYNEQRAKAKKKHRWVERSKEKDAAVAAATTKRTIVTKIKIRKLVVHFIGWCSSSCTLPF